MSEADVKAVKRLEFWIALAFTIAGLGAGSVLYLNRYAEAADLDRVESAFHSHVESEVPRVTGLEEVSKHVEEDLHWQREQVQRIAERVGAMPVPPPNHLRGEKP